MQAKKNKLNGWDWVYKEGKENAELLQPFVIKNKLKIKVTCAEQQNRVRVSKRKELDGGGGMDTTPQRG